jgi:hypothetical protein
MIDLENISNSDIEKVIDELMEAVLVLQPKLYNAVIDKLKE